MVRVLRKSSVILSQARHFSIVSRCLLPAISRPCIVQAAIPNFSGQTLAVPRMIDVAHSRRFSSQGLSQAEYEQISTTTMENLYDTLEQLGDTAEMDRFDCEYSNGVITLQLASHGSYVINRQPPNKQIWLSSPISGPKRYDYCRATGRWLYNREKLSLEESLSEELSSLLGSKVCFPTSRSK